MARRSVENSLINYIYSKGYTMDSFTKKCQIDRTTIWRNIRLKEKFRGSTIYLMANELKLSYEEMERLANGL